MASKPEALSNLDRLPETPGDRTKVFSASIISDNAQCVPVRSIEKEDWGDIKLNIFQSTSRAPLLSQIRQKYRGWKAGLKVIIFVDTLVLFLNLALTLAAAFAFPREGLQAILVRDSCSRTRTWQIWLHLAINVISTVLLSTSSYAMQCLGSPTRNEVDKAHSRRRFMNIGIPSLTNIFHVRRRRFFLWSALVLSSLPIHLLANSAVYETIGANSYVLFVVDERFVTEPLSDMLTGYAYGAYGFNSPNKVLGGPGGRQGSPKNVVDLGFNTTAQLKGIVPTMERLENADCIKAYSDPLAENRGNVLAVARSPNVFSNLTGEHWNYISDVYYQSVDFCPDCQTYLNWTDPTTWTCSFVADDPGTVQNCDTNKAIKKASEFEIDSMPIDHCMSSKVVGRCQLRADVGILSVTIICAFVKTLIVYAAFLTIPEQILATIGDAIASFLRTPEPLTAEASLLSRGDIYSKKWTPGTPLRKHWSPSSLTRKWGQGPRGTAWGRTLLLMISTLIIAITLLGIGVNKVRKTKTGLNNYGSNDGAPPVDGGALMRMGFGAVNVNTILMLPNMNSSENIVGHILLVNTPQLLLSMVYFVYNNSWTSMLVAREWAKFGKTRQPLRTSIPVGSQRSNYFLTIPYRFAIPLQACSALLHWLLSQSLFLARVDVYPAAPFVTQPPAIINTVGYSLISLVFFVILWAVLFITLISFGICGKLNSPMPVAAGCSLVISAACHLQIDEYDAALKPLAWGVIDEMEKEDGTKHCAFSSHEVYSPARLPRRKEGRYGGDESEAIFA